MESLKSKRDASILRVATATIHLQEIREKVGSAELELQAAIQEWRGLMSETETSDAKGK